MIPISSPEKKTEQQQPKSKVKIKDPEIFRVIHVPPEFKESFEFVVIREQFLHQMAEVFATMRSKGYECQRQVNCYSKDLHFIFEKIRKPKKKTTKGK